MEDEREGGDLIDFRDRVYKTIEIWDENKRKDDGMMSYMTHVSFLGYWVDGKKQLKVITDLRIL